MKNVASSLAALLAVLCGASFFLPLSALRWALLTVSSLVLSSALRPLLSPSFDGQVKLHEMYQLVSPSPLAKRMSLVMRSDSKTLAALASRASRVALEFPMWGCRDEGACFVSAQIGPDAAPRIVPAALKSPGWLRLELSEGELASLRDRADVFVSVESNQPISFYARDAGGRSRSRSDVILEADVPREIPGDGIAFVRFLFLDDSGVPLGVMY
ncbi:MAG: hypothetical protein IT290_07645 [Deltaproteobacteria bacterium]|nr:hypothetical protein [Deltaproteobacteria bacterium]